MSAIDKKLLDMFQDSYKQLLEAVHNPQSEDFAVHVASSISLDGTKVHHPKLLTTLLSAMDTEDEINLLAERVVEILDEWGQDDGDQPLSQKEKNHLKAAIQETLTEFHKKNRIEAAANLALAMSQEDGHVTEETLKDILPQLKLNHETDRQNVREAIREVDAKAMIIQSPERVVHADGLVAQKTPEVSRKDGLIRFIVKSVNRAGEEIAELFSAQLSPAATGPSLPGELGDRTDFEIDGLKLVLVKKSKFGSQELEYVLEGKHASEAIISRISMNVHYADGRILDLTPEDYMKTKSWRFPRGDVEIVGYELNVDMEFSNGNS